MLPPETVPETVTDLSGESTEFPFAVTVTVPVLVVAPAAIVNSSALDNVKSAATAPVPAAAATVTVTAALDTPESVAVTVDTPLLSETDDGDSASATVGNASSSVSVNVAPEGAATPLPPETVPETVTDLSGESTEFPFAVTVTVPVLVVAPDTIVNSSALDNEKSPETAPEPAAAPTVTVTASLDAPESVAVTVDTPLLSETDDGDSTSVTVGSVSSSVSVNVAFDGAATPLPPETVPETVTDLSGESTEFPFAVTVTVPVLVVSPDAIVNLSTLDNEKSPETAPEPAAAPTVTVTASLEAPESVAVTVDTPLLSETDDGDSASVNVGSVSSSVSVKVTPEGAATPLPPETVPETVTDLSGESTTFPFAVTVTVPVLVVSPDAIVNLSTLDNVKSPAAAPAPAAAPTVTVTAALDTPESVAVTVDTPLLSEIDDEDNASVNVGSVSSSVSVKVTPEGAATLLPPETVPETVTDLSGESTVFPFAVTVTVPVLVVSPDAIVNLSALDNVKSPETAPVPAAAPTVTVTASLEAPESVAVTVDTPLLSETDDGDSTSATVGNVSSSVSVNVASDGAATLLPPETVPETVTDLSGESTVFPFAVTVTVPVLVVSPGAIVNLSALDNVKSPETAPAPAAAATVTVTAALDDPESVAVTVDTPLLSETDDGDSTRVTVGNASSSVIVNVTPEGAATPLAPETVPETVTDLFGESTEFPFAVTVTVPVLVVSPDAIVNSSALDNVKSPDTAGDTAAAATVTVTAALDAPESVAVTVDTPLLSDTDVGDSDSVTVGGPSSSRIVSVTLDGAATLLPPEAVPETVTDLFGSSLLLSTAVIVTVPVLVVSPDAIVSAVVALSM